LLFTTATNKSGDETAIDRRSDRWDLILDLNNHHGSKRVVGHGSLNLARFAPARDAVLPSSRVRRVRVRTRRNESEVIVVYDDFLNRTRDYAEAVSQLQEKSEGLDQSSETIVISEEQGRIQAQNYAEILAQLAADADRGDAAAQTKPRHPP
jgi:hypothetical protein